MEPYDMSDMEVIRMYFALMYTKNLMHGELWDESMARIKTEIKFRGLEIPKEEDY